MTRTYVLDTNVLIHDPKSMFVFEEHQVVIPILVIEELDKFKTEPTERGYNARTVARYITKLAALAEAGERTGSLKEGVSLEGGGTLRVAWDGELETDHPRSTDHAVLRMAKDMADASKDPVILVSRDANVRIKAMALGLAAEDYRHDKVQADPDRQYSGVQMAEGEDLDEDINALHGGDFVDDLGLELHPNEFVIVKGSGKKSALARWRGPSKGLVEIPSKYDAWKIAPRNKEQTMALDLLLDPHIELVTLTGIAGTGKTLLAIAAGLHLVADRKAYRKLLVSRPLIPMGKDVGYLPGTLDEKLNPWMQPIFDNLEVLVSGETATKKGPPEKAYQYLIDTGMLEVEALTYIRGRSIPKQYLIVDEAQNLTPHEVKTILTRAGEGTKIVLTGDPAQIDNPYVDSRSNGLTYTVERFKDSARAGHITLKKGERSGLAAEAAERL